METSPGKHRRKPDVPLRFINKIRRVTRRDAASPEQGLERFGKRLRGRGFGPRELMLDDIEERTAPDVLSLQAARQDVGAS
jgi:hypothetical protein